MEEVRILWSDHDFQNLIGFQKELFVDGSHADLYGL